MWWNGLEVLLLVYCAIGLVIGLFAWMGLKTIELAEEKLNRRLTDGELAACLFLLPWSPFYVVFVIRDRAQAPALTRRVKVYSNGVDYLTIVEDR